MATPMHVTKAEALQLMTSPAIIYSDMGGHLYSEVDIILKYGP